MSENRPDPLSGRLVLVRHGQTDWNKAGRMQGSTDIELNGTGREQVAAAGRRIAEDGGRWDLLAASPLSRAQETARILGAEVGLTEIETVPGLVERNYGAAEGQVLSFEESRHPQDLYDGVEPIEDVYRRGIASLKDLVLAHPGQSILVVSHGTTIRRVLRASTPGDWSAAVPNATPIEVDLEGLFAWDPQGYDFV